MVVRGQVIYGTDAEKRQTIQEEGKICDFPLVDGNGRPLVAAISVSASPAGPAHPCRRGAAAIPRPSGVGRKGIFLFGREVTPVRGRGRGGGDGREEERGGEQGCQFHAEGVHAVAASPATAAAPVPRKRRREGGGVACGSFDGSFMVRRQIGGFPCWDGRVMARVWVWPAALPRRFGGEPCAARCGQPSPSRGAARWFSPISCLPSVRWSASIHLSSLGTMAGFTSTAREPPGDQVFWRVVPRFGKPAPKANTKGNKHHGKSETRIWHQLRLDEDSSQRQAGKNR